MTDYEQEFDKLTCYSHQYYIMEDQRTRKFIRGLQPEIHKISIPLSITSYHDSVQKAMLVEQEETETGTALI